MKSALFLLLCAAILAGCKPTRSANNDTEKLAASIENLTLLSHLNGSIENDPQLRTGQKFRLVPDPSEPITKHDSLLVQLPTQTPYDGVDSQFYLRGYAIGQMSAHNGQFL